MDIQGDTGTTYEVDKLVRVIDGDTVRARFRRIVEVVDLGSGEELVTYRRDRPESFPDGTSCRLTTLDTPEKKGATLAEGKRAQADHQLWWDTQLAAHRTVYARIYAGGGFDRILVTFFVLEEELSLSEWMLRERGWLPYVRGV